MKNYILIFLFLFQIKINTQNEKPFKKDQHFEKIKIKKFNLFMSGTLFGIISALAIIKKFKL